MDTTENPTITKYDFSLEGLNMNQIMRDVDKRHLRLNIINYAIETMGIGAIVTQP